MKTVFLKSISHACATFTIMLLVISVTGWLAGDSVQGLSSFFRMGSDGIAHDTIAQTFGFSILIACLEAFIFDSGLLSKLMSLWKTVLLLSAALGVAIVFIIAFRWFPTNYVQCWVLFFLCFGGSAAISIGAMHIKTKAENKKYARLLEEYKAKRVE